MPFQAVNKDLIHRISRSKNVLNTKRLNNTTDVCFGPFRDESIVQCESQHAKAHVCQATDHVSAVLATAQESQAIEFAFVRFRIKKRAELVHRLKPGLSSLLVFVE